MSDAPGRVTGRVLRAVGGTYRVETEDGVLECALRGRVKQKKKELGRVAVGDRVDIEILDDGGCAIVDVRPRRTKLSRKTAHGRREQIIAVNVDRLGAVFSIARPDPEFWLLDRFLVAGEANDIAPFIVVNKIDLSSEDEAREQFADYAAADYEIVLTSAETGAGIEELADHLVDHITIFAGPSGAGKSSLLNAIQPDLGLRVGEVSRALETGKHTTVAASLHPLDVGGYVVDTPGLRQLQFWEVSERELDICFPEFRPYLGACRFPDCRHTQEPGCAVLEAVESGAISEARHGSYVRILEERAADRPY